MPELSESPAPKKAWAPVVVIGLLLALHLAAVARLLPPERMFLSQPILGADHPAHAHRVGVYRQALDESGLPWGYNPQVCAGVLVRPTQDAGAKPQQFLGVLLQRFSSGWVIRLFLLASAASFPLFVLGALRGMRLPWSEAAWVLAVLLAPAWLYQNLAGFFQWGLAAFALSSYMAPLVLVLFLRFLDRPSSGRYALAVLSLSFMTLLHVLGPVVIAPALLLFTCFARPLAVRWRLAALAAPLLVFAANAFWLVPFLLDFRTPAAPRPQQFFPADLTYFSLRHLLDMISPARLAAAVLAVTLAGYGLVQLKRIAGSRTAIAIGLSAAVGLFLKFAGSFLPVIVTMQPARFLLGAVALLSVPAGVAVCDLCARMRIPKAPAALAAVLALVVLAAVWRDSNASQRQHVNFAGSVEREAPTFLSLPQAAPEPPGFDELSRFVAERTQPEDRLLVQTRIQAEQTALAEFWGREVVGNAYPDVHDEANFLLNAVWGRKLGEWAPQDFRESLDRWGIAWVITFNKKATQLAQAALDSPGEPVGPYTVFQVPGDHDRFLAGAGRMDADVNRLRLTELRPQDGRVVLRYRYHPAWELEGSGRLVQHAIPESPLGFLAIESPGEEVTLHFRPWKMFTARWPD